MKVARGKSGSHGVLSLATFILLNGLACGGGSGATSDAGTGGGSLDAASAGGTAGGSVGNSDGGGGSGRAGTSGSGGASGYNDGGASGSGAAGQGGGAGGHGDGGVSGGGGHNAGGASGGGGSGIGGAGGALQCSGGAAGGPANPQCPATPPGPTSCTKESLQCIYDDCPASGRTIATCTSGTWSVQTGACGPVSCIQQYSKGCASGQLCVVTETGAIQATCIANPCGAGPVTFQCLTSYQSSYCNINATITTGVTLNCDYCGTTCE